MPAAAELSPHADGKEAGMLRDIAGELIACVRSCVRGSRGVAVAAAVPRGAHP